MQSAPRLSRTLLASGLLEQSAVSVAADAMLALPEKAVQFGTGAFLRGFIEFFVDQANREGAFEGRVVVVGSTGSGRDHLLNEQDGLYTLSIQGIDNGIPHEEHQVISCVSRALSASDDWESVLECARNPALELVFSNTTEVGIALDEEDSAELAPPRSFPGKLTRFLHERAIAFNFDPAAGLIVLPCELIEDNGTRLGEIVGMLARRWALGDDFTTWLDASVTFCNTLVDRIVTGAPVGDRIQRLRRAIGYADEMLTVCESYKLFAIEGDDSLRTRVPFATQAGVIVAPDIAPYRDRKVRLLNGTHTISVPVALLCGCHTVREAMEDDLVGRFIRTVVFDDIVPSLEVPGAEAFARETLDRFANPYIDHALVDITLQATMKMRVRVVPSIVNFMRLYGRVPQSLAFGFAAYLDFVRKHSNPVPGDTNFPALTDDQAADVVTVFDSNPNGSNDVESSVHAVLADTALWGVDLTRTPAFASAVAEHLGNIQRIGVARALDAHLGAAQCR